MPLSGTDITTFGEEVGFRIASKSSLELRIRGRLRLKPWPHAAADEAKLGVLARGIPKLAQTTAVI